MTDFPNRWAELYHLLNYTHTVSPRGLETKECYFVQCEMTDDQFDWFRERKLNLDYIRREFQWYLGGDQEDMRIAEHAPIWSEHVNRDGSLSSNYGYYLFRRGGMARALQQLRNDPDSRRAVISIYNQFEHSKPGINDVPCTCSISFLIRNKHLHMAVHMRSNDLILGLGNDAPCFHWFHQLAYWHLKDTYPELKMGKHIHRADSLHVYEKHFRLLAHIGTGSGHWEPERVPVISSVKEAKALIAGEQTKEPFSKWLYQVEL